MVCRACKADKTSTVLNLGEQMVTGFGQEKRSAPLRLMLCSNCGLVQLSHSVPKEWFHEWYGYRSGINEEMVEALKAVADACEERLRGISGAPIVDIGCNDGTFMKFFKGRSKERVGFDPARNLAGLGSHNCDYLVEGVFSARSQPQIFEHLAGKSQLVTALAMFYDLEDPKEFLRDVKFVLARDGLFVIQMNYLGMMVRNCAFDNISHEHVAYYALSTLLPVIKEAGLEAFEVEQNHVNGGSFRIYCRHAGSSFPAPVHQGTVEQMLEEEADQKLDRPETYADFKVRVEKTCRALSRFLREAQLLGQKTAICGASTRGLVILQAAGIGADLIECASERNPDKWGKEYASTGIKCVPEEEARAGCKIFLLLPYHLRDAIMRREEKFLEGGGKFVIPLPHPTVNWSNGKRTPGGHLILNSSSLLEA